ncbi:DUF2809 domain-containing protein [Isoptericola sp. S6320L]|uniref:DUF2809 domain-containing protein n=1 Tax=Isoptericola sp. S6320L TaxID=2926411 RepID=UPI001FF0FDAF|nr:DUF2809 domain-containing protein [Isoptericola sp. S6320L]MCK0115914.1 DUF2809 domain-containing protein [Isoptericola sp. S6320L]
MTSPDARVPRAASAVLVVVTVLAGLGGRRWLPADVAGPLGDVLYAMLVVWLVVLVFPRAPRGLASATALALCTAIELSHLTEWPAALLERLPAARFVLGTTFGAADLAWYALGAFLGGALLVVVGGRPEAVDEALRHVRAARARPAGRRITAFLVPLALLGVVAAAGIGVGRSLSIEADELAARVEVAQAELDGSADKVADDDVRSALSTAIDDAGTVLEGRPVLDRRPGDATDAGERLERAVTAVHDSRRTFATTAAAEVRETFAPVQRKAERILTATDELADAGQAADESARAALRDALDAATAAHTTTGPDHLTELPLAELEGVAGDLTTRRDDVDLATHDLMSAQDAAVCPEPDQVWFPQAGKLTAKRLAPIPWAPQHSVRADLLEGLVALDEAYQAEFGEHLTVNSGYRSYDDQLAVYNPDQPNPLAAPPGCSNHGLGTAVDLSMGPESFDGARYAWMKEHAEEYGWTHPAWAEPDGRLPEPWHWESVETPLGY